jgi:hypothetical protein
MGMLNSGFDKGLGILEEYDPSKGDPSDVPLTESSVSFVLKVTSGEHTVSPISPSADTLPIAPGCARFL